MAHLDRTNSQQELGRVLHVHVLLLFLEGLVDDESGVRVLVVSVVGDVLEQPCLRKEVERERDRRRNQLDDEENEG